MNYDRLLIEADRNYITTKEKPLHGGDGRIRGNKIAIRKDIPTLTEKACVLAEELGHYHTTIGDILNQEDVKNRNKNTMPECGHITVK